jgi:hypothetical protein
MTEEEKKGWVQISMVRANALSEFDEATCELHAAELKAQELVSKAKERYARALQALHKLAIGEK